MSNEDPTSSSTTTGRSETAVVGEEQEYEEEFEIEIRTQKGSSIKVETTSYNKVDDLLEKAFTTYQRIAKEESGARVDEKQQYQ
jgi:hypothetical protein